jgi:hypothetical protein
MNEALDDSLRAGDKEFYEKVQAARERSKRIAEENIREGVQTPKEYNLAMMIDAAKYALHRGLRTQANLNAAIDHLSPQSLDELLTKSDEMLYDALLFLEDAEKEVGKEGASSDQH